MKTILLATILIIYSDFALGLGKEVLIRPEQSETQKIIYGTDIFELDRYEGFDRYQSRQEQVDDSVIGGTGQPQTDSPWNLENNDFDSYQEIQSRKLINFEKRRGKLPLKYY